MSDLARAQGVRDVVTRIAHTIDFRRWSDLRALYAEQVRTDYTSLFGGEVQQPRVDDLIEGGGACSRRSTRPSTCSGRSPCSCRAAPRSPNATSAAITSCAARPAATS
jgi:hypothetical protein